MSIYSEISIAELEAKEKKLIFDTETLRIRVITELNKIEKDCAN